MYYIYKKVKTYHSGNVDWIELVKASVVLTIPERERESWLAFCRQCSNVSSIVKWSQKTSQVLVWQWQAVARFTTYTVSSHREHPLMVWIRNCTSGVRQPPYMLYRVANKRISHCYYVYTSLRELVKKRE
jgi:hypothetical protein